MQTMLNVQALLDHIDDADILQTPEGLEGPWKNKIRTVMKDILRVHTAVSDIESSLSSAAVNDGVSTPPPTRWANFFKACQQTLVLGVQFVEAVYENAKSKLDGQMNSVAAEISPIAKGDPEGSGASWPGDESPASWDDWGILQSRYEDTLKRMKSTAFKCISKAKVLLSSASDLEELFDKVPNSVSTAVLTEPLSDFVVTKPSVVCMRTLTKYETLEETRPRIQAELKEAMDWFKERERPFDWTSQLPAALAQRMQHIIAGKLPKK